MCVTHRWNMIGKKTEDKIYLHSVRLSVKKRTENARVRFFCCKNARKVIELSLEVWTMRMIPKKETLTIEFKSDIDCLDEKELVSEIVGMTNTEGGVLYLGVEDNGDITGVHKKQFVRKMQMSLSSIQWFTR